MKLKLAARRLLVSLALTWWAWAASADPWPGGSGTEIGNVGMPGGLPAGYEPSGAVWHPRLGVLLLVSDNGWVSRMDADGQNAMTWLTGGDLEAIAIADADVRVGRLEKLLEAKRACGRPKDLEFLRAFESRK